MKDWDYYRTGTEKCYSWHEIHRQMLQELDEQKLTVAERTAAAANVSARATEETNRLNAPYREERGRLEDEFWRDARRELEYEDWLCPKAAAAVEYKAYEDGHSSGYPEIFCQLQDLVAFVREIETHQAKARAKK